jgi:hypothetical protein
MENSIRYKVFILLGILFIGCSTKRFNINEVDFSHKEMPQSILPLRYYDRSNINPETAEKIVKGVLATDSNVWGYYYIHHAVDRKEIGLFSFEIFGIPITDILVFLGMPKSRVYYDMTADIYLFDSNGDIIEIDEKTTTIMKYKGFYYGHNPPIKEMSEEYKKMFDEIVNKINGNKVQINNFLESAGILEEEYSPEVYTKIYKIIK